MRSKTTGKSVTPLVAKAIVAIIALTLSCPLLLSCSCSPIEKVELEREVEICNLSDGIYSNTHGDAFCISSSASGIFSFYILDENNGYHLCTIPADRTTVYCESNAHYLTIRMTILGSNSQPYDDKTDLDFLNYIAGWYDPRYELHIPEGSIVEDFKLDVS